MTTPPPSRLSNLQVSPFPPTSTTSFKGFLWLQVTAETFFSLDPQKGRNKLQIQAQLDPKVEFLKIKLLGLSPSVSYAFLWRAGSQLSLGPWREISHLPVHFGKNWNRLSFCWFEAPALYIYRTAIGARALQVYLRPGCTHVPSHCLPPLLILEDWYQMNAGPQKEIRVPVL